MKKTAIVTGSSRGIGYAIARQLGLDGCNIVMVATGPQEKNQAALDALEALGIRCAYVQANVADHDDLQRMVGYQIRKFNACRKCLKCESICRQGAISIIGDSYYVDPKKCIHCKMCMTAKYLDGGCMMDKYLRTK